MKIGKWKITLSSVICGVKKHEDLGLLIFRVCVLPSLEIFYQRTSGKERSKSLSNTIDIEISLNWLVFSITLQIINRSNKKVTDEKAN